MESNDCVTLVPFVHQVGGHNGIMTYDEATVCKPASPAELHFYETLTPEIAQFTPGFKGVVRVSVQEEDDGSLSVRAYPVRAHRQTSSVLLPNSAWTPDPTGSLDRKWLQKSNQRRASKRKHPQWRRSEPTSDGSSGDDLFEDHSESKTTHHRFEKGNPWGVYLNRLQTARMHRDVSSGKIHKFILLENLTSQFHFPCILDVKFGTRTYHKAHSEEKRQMHIDRDAATTTASLGLRLCGMQVYQPSRGCYKCRNKYDGRGLTKDGLRRALLEYFTTGENVRMELIPPFVEKLNALIHVVATVTTFSFHSSSLLLIYEGDLHRPSTCLKDSEEDSPESVVDLRIIDFANTEQDPDSFSGEKESGNGGCIYGLRNLVQILKDIQGIKPL